MKCSAFRIAALYAVIGGLWIIFSDGLARLITDDPLQLLYIETAKGWVYVLTTSALLYGLLRWHFRHQEEQQQVATAALLASERNYHEIFNATNDAIFVHDAGSGAILDVNQRMLEMYGYSADEALKLTVGDVSFGEAPYSQKEAVAWVKKAVEQGPQVFEWLCRKKNGELFWTEVALRSTRIGGEGRVLAVVRDVSDRKNAQKDLQQLATAVGQVVEAIVITDLKGNILYANRAFETITGYTPAEVIGKSSRILKSGKHDADFYRDLWQTIESGEVWRGFFVNRKKDGTIYHEESAISPVKDPSGRITSYVAVKRDVTREMSLQLQLLQSQKMEAVGRLAGGVAHDFNNMLTSIVGYGELSLHRLAPDDRLRHHIEEILKSAGRATSLTRQLLAFSRKQVLEARLFDLNDLVTKLHSMLRRLIGEDIELVLDLQPAALWNIKSDPTQIEQVIVNMALNARDAMPHGGKLTIQTATATITESTPTAEGIPPGQYVCLTITDTGMGMTDDVKSHLFEPFFTTKSRDKGTGLGLATSYGIIRQTGGYIRVTTKPNEGATFHIYLPRADGETRPPAIEPHAIEPTPAGKPGEIILLVEDEEAVREPTRLGLVELGYTVLTAGNGVEAMRLLEGRDGERLDLLLTDVVMPQMGGRELAEQVLRHKPGLKVLFISGYAPDAIEHHGVLLPGTAFLPKPYTLAVLARKIREVIDSAH